MASKQTIKVSLNIKILFFIKIWKIVLIISTGRYSSTEAYIDIYEEMKILKSIHYIPKWQFQNMSTKLHANKKSHNIL